VTTLIPKIETELSIGDCVYLRPPVMYKFVLMALQEAEVPKERIFLNLEEKMKCGVGKCGHCQINNFYTPVSTAGIPLIPTCVSPGGNLIWIDQE